MGPAGQGWGRGGRLTRLAARSGWWVVGASVAVQVLLSALFLQSFGAYASVWADDFRWSKTMLATAFSLTRLESGLLGPVQGWLLQRYGVRAVMRTGMVLLAAGYLALSRVHAVTPFYLAIAVVGLGASLAGILSIITIIVNWFEARRATALAVMQLGQSVGGLAVPLVALGILRFGWRGAAVISAGLFLTIGLAAVQLMVDRRPARDADDAGEEGTASVAASIPTRATGGAAPRDFGFREALATRSFWLLSAGHGLAMMGISAVTVHLIVDLTTYHGFALTRAATVLSLVTVAAMAGQLTGGFLGDRTDKRRLAAMAVSLHVPAFVILAFDVNVVGAVVFACLHGLAWGVRTPLMASLRADYFGRASFATIMGMSTTLVMIGGVLGPIVAGAMADRTGSYQASFVLLAATSALAVLAFWWAKAPARPPSSVAETS